MNHATAVDGDVAGTNITSSITYTTNVNVAVAGIYYTTYTVTNSDGQTATRVGVVIVNDTSFTVGGACPTTGITYIIQARNFTKRVNQVNTSHPAVITAAEANAWRIIPNVQTIAEARIQTGATVNNLGGYTATPGTYNITFGAQGQTTAPITTRQITATVITGSIPELNVTTPIEINVGDTFNYMDGVTATCTEDGNITTQVTYTQTVNTQIPGVYEITYTITNSHGNTTTRIRVVVVNDGSFEVDGNYIIQARDFTKRVTEVNTANSAIISASEARAWRVSNIGATQIPVEVINNGGYTAQVGTYNIILGINPTRTIVATVIDCCEEYPDCNCAEENNNNNENNNQKNDNNNQEPNNIGKGTGNIVNTADGTNTTIYIALIGIGTSLMLMFVLLKEKKD